MEEPRARAKRTFRDIRVAILLCLSFGKQTINQISFKTRINWKSVKVHLNYLREKGLVNNVLNSEYARVFELSDEGIMYLKLLELGNKNQIQKEEKEIIK